MDKSIKASILTRLFVSFAFVIFIYLFRQVSVFSAFVGVLACLIPESYQGWKVSKAKKIFEPNAWLRVAYQSMLTKWLMTAMIFAISFSSDVQWDYTILFTGYLLVNIFGLLAPILFKGKK